MPDHKLVQDLNLEHC